jgi:tripartite motif-containing protein 2/3
MLFNMAAKFPEDLAVGAACSLCVICTEACHNARSLDCGHTFCGGCLDRYCHSLQQDGSVESSAAIPCPSCRQLSSCSNLTTTNEVSSSSESGVTVDDPLTSIAAMIESPKPVFCDVCRYKKRESFAREHCPTCTINLCEHCKNEHDRHTPFRGHAAVPVTQRDRSALKCEQHESEFVRYYCSACIAPLCAVCAVVDHVGHSTTDLNDALLGKREALDSSIRGISEHVVHYEEAVARLEDVHGILEAAVKKTRLEIERHSAALIAAINHNQHMLIDELDLRYKASKKVIDIERENCATQLASMKSLWKFAAKLMEPGQALQLLAMYSDVSKMIDSITRSPEPRLPREATRMTMFVPKEQLNVGELQTCDISMDLIKRVSSTTGDSGIESPRATSPVPSLSDLPSPTSRTIGQKFQTPKLLWKTDKTGQRTGEINEPYGVTISSDGTVVVAEWLNQRLQVFDATGYTRNIFGQGIIQPWGVAFTPDGMLAITDEKDHTVKVFHSQTGEVISSWKKNTFGWPRGIAVNSAGHIIVSDAQHSKHTVGIYLPDGRCLSEFGSQGSGNSQFHWPRYIAVDCHRGDRIVVSDGSNNCVKIFDATGQFIMKFGSVGVGDGRLKHPRGIAVDPVGNILVADQDNNRVSLFTGEGQFIRHVLSIHKPWGIAINESGLLAVTHKQSVSLYKMLN